MDLEAHERLRERLRADPAKLVPDGPVVPERYAKARPRLLWVLREIDGVGGWDYREFLATDAALFTYNRWQQTLGLVAKVSTGILNGCIPSGAWMEDASRLTDSLRDLAIINLNKGGGGSTVDWKQFPHACATYQSVVAEQLDYLDPDIIILAGTCGLITDGLPEVVRELPESSSEGIISEGRLFLGATHPNQRRLTHEAYYERLRAAILGAGTLRYTADPV